MAELKEMGWIGEIRQKEYSFKEIYLKIIKC